MKALLADWFASYAKDNGVPQEKAEQFIEEMAWPDQHEEDQGRVDV